MRILKSIGLVVMAGLYVLLVINVPFMMMMWVLGLFATVGIFCWGYFVLFKPK